MAKKKSKLEERQARIQQVIDLLFEASEVLDDLHSEFDGMRSIWEEKLSTRYERIEAITAELDRLRCEN